jgi:ubiquinone/menaquinone biosynthesis C-methylase UbiE
VADAAEFFDERAVPYDRAYDARGTNGHALRARMDAVLRLVGSGPGDLLDAGMGPGRLASALSARGWTVAGVDASQEMVAAAGRHLPEEASRFVVAKIEALPFPDASFDVVTATGVLEYANVPSALDELARVLRPGGRAVVSYPNPGAVYSFLNTHGFYPVVRAMKRLAGHPSRLHPRGSRPFVPARFRELLSAAGLEPQTTEHASFLVLPPPLDVFLPGAAQAIGRRLEGSGPRLGRRLATQAVYSARKA